MKRIPLRVPPAALQRLELHQELGIEWMKKEFFITVLIMALIFTAVLCAQCLSAQSGGDNAVLPQGETKVPWEGKGLDKKLLEHSSGKDSSKEKEQEEKKVQKPSLKKNPRIKYWNPYECGC